VLTKLSNKPVHLKEFANQVQVIAGFREQEKNLYKQTSQVDQLYNLLQQNEFKVPSEDLVLHEDLHERQQEYRREIEVAQNYRDMKMPEMISNVEANILKLQDQVSSTVSRLEDEIFVELDSFNDPEKVLEELSQLGSRLENADQLAKTYTGYQKLFTSPVTVQKELENGKEKWDSLKQLWETTKSWLERSKFWQESQFTELQVEEVDKEVQQFFKDSFGLQKRLGSKASEMLKDKVAEFKTMMPNILDLGNPNMRARHFEKIFRLIGEKYYTDMPFSLSFLLKGGIMNQKDSVQEISASASGEAQLESSLDKIKSDWENQVFTVLNHRDQHGLFILGGLDEIFVLLEDHQVSLQTMLGSRYVRGVQDRVDEWEKKLGQLSETLDEWLACQRSWMYLENIFGAEDIQKQLPAESQKFLVVDRSWKLIMNRTYSDPKVLAALLPLESGATLLGTFVMNNEALESIQKSLEEYLETKRMAFPRFYFLSNDELLEIMSQTRDPHAVQPHMSKCFDAIKRIKFGEGRQSHDILGFSDPSGENVPLADSVKAEGAVEVWLLNFERAMRQTLYDRSKNAYESYPKTLQESINRKEWLWGFPAQVVIAIDQVLWTSNVTVALISMEGGNENIPQNSKAMEEFLAFSLKQIDAMVELVRAPLDKQQRTLLGALLTIDVHARDVIRALVSKKIRHLTDFEWTKQLRYYWEEKEDDIFAKQTNSSFRYGYEYLGNGPRLVITPLTDTCYM
jgi:dynein heavy chain